MVSWIYWAYNHGSKDYQKVKEYIDCLLYTSDYETNAFIFDPSTTNQLHSMFERDKKNSTLLTPELWKKRSGWKKFLGWVGNLLTPFL